MQAYEVAALSLIVRNDSLRFPFYILRSLCPISYVIHLLDLVTCAWI